ncbi:hypothetical protein FISHEDRAFT_63719 [Fistulina hepatica ATCC 64428]|uniref:Transcriptional regulator of RNA polII, SAGA, subunit-domain-containing protein n=1 Tax=Fistulina hepatica ATCC 64428 TaxID=1128425 RepID=A0A0D7AMK6_9AGAR|nr:hypothetical protein FISHEDRAFT_63719 [Fistulina hepatica ATCC 64428]
MSLSTTSNLKAQLVSSLGANASLYFDCLSDFVSGKISRTEFEDVVRVLLDTSALVQTHNALIISLFDATAYRRPPPTPPPEPVRPPPRKRRRILPYQGPETKDEDLTYHSTRLKKWVLSIGRQERERIRVIQSHPQLPRPRPETDEMARERGVVLLPERGDPPGSRVAVPLAAVSGAPTAKDIAERINLICAQNNLGTPAANVATLMNIACELKLKQLITHALSITASSDAISSITTSSAPSNVCPAYSRIFFKILTAASFRALFAIVPFSLPTRSAAATNLFSGPSEGHENEPESAILRAREVHDPRWQICGLLAERSAWKDVERSNMS